MLLNLSYEQISTLLALVGDNLGDDNYTGLESLDQTLTTTLEDAWHPGTVLTPMMTTFNAYFLSEDLQGEFKAKRTELADSYSPSTVLLEVQMHDGKWEQFTVRTNQFSWRYL